MKVIIFGSTGTIGKHLIKQSLEKGYLVTAFSRDTDKLSSIDHANLSMTKGDVLNPNDVKNAILGQNAVIIVLGSGKDRNNVVRSQGTRNIIDAMKINNVSRLICQTTLGVGESNANLNIFWKYIMFGWFLKNIFQDHELQEEYVKKSNLDWTIVRPSAFTDEPLSQKYIHGFDSNIKNLKLKISRADVAHFILEQLQSDKYLYQTPGLSN